MFTKKNFKYWISSLLALSIISGFMYKIFFIHNLQKPIGEVKIGLISKPGSKSVVSDSINYLLGKQVDAYLEKKDDSKGVDVDNASLLVGAVALLLTIMVLFTFRDFEQLDRINDMVQKADITQKSVEKAVDELSIEQKKLNDTISRLEVKEKKIESDFDRNNKEFNTIKENFELGLEEAKKTNFNTYFGIFSRTIESFFNQNLIDEITYVLINNEIACAKIEQTDVDLRMEGFNTLFARGTMKDTSFLEAVFLSEIESKEIKDKALLAFKAILSRNKPKS
ncbi:hypothetical protein [Spirosoma gilvum]